MKNVFFTSAVRSQIGAEPQSLLPKTRAHSHPAHDPVIVIFSIP